MLLNKKLELQIDKPALIYTLFQLLGIVMAHLLGCTITVRWTITHGTIIRQWASQTGIPMSLMGIFNLAVQQ